MTEWIDRGIYLQPIATIESSQENVLVRPRSLRSPLSTSRQEAPMMATLIASNDISNDLMYILVKLCVLALCLVLWWAVVGHSPGHTT